MPEKDEQPLSVMAAAEKLGVTRQTLAPWVNEHENELTVIMTPGGQRRVYVSEIRKLREPAERIEELADIDSELDENDDETQRIGGKPAVASGEIPGFTPKQTTTSHIEYRIVNDSGKRLDVWGNMPTGEEIHDAYGPGKYRVFQIDCRTQKILSCELIEVESDNTVEDDEERTMSKLQKMARFTADLRGDAGGVQTELVKSLMLQNTELMKMLITNKQQDPAGNGSERGSQLKDFLSGITFAKEIGAAAGQAGEGAGGGTASLILEKVLDIVRDIAPAVAEKILEGPEKGDTAAQQTTAIKIRPKDNITQPVKIKQE